MPRNVRYFLVFLLVLVVIFHMQRNKTSFKKNTAMDVSYATQYHGRKEMQLYSSIKFSESKTEGVGTGYNSKSLNSNMQMHSISRHPLIVKGKPFKKVPSPPRNFLTSDSELNVKSVRLLHFLHDKQVRMEVKRLASPWISKLQDLLHKVHLRKQVSVVFSNLDYLEILLNWLINAKVRAKPPLKNVMVVCLDRAVFDILDHGGISSIFIDPNTVISSDAHMISNSSYIWIIRCVVYRLINYLGYDVVSYDSDAIVLKDPGLLFKQYQNSDIIGSPGVYPYDLSKEWGFTLCMGVIMFRSTPRTELLWESDGSYHNKIDDQVLLNYALKRCGIVWYSGRKGVPRTHGLCPNGLKVTLLTTSDICRRCIGREKRKYNFVWHQTSPRSSFGKFNIIKKGNLWFLRSDWKVYESRQKVDKNRNLRGVEWLVSLSTLI